MLWLSKSDKIGSVLLEPALLVLWWFVRLDEVFIPGESILRKLEAPLVSLVFWLTCLCNSWETDVSAETTASLGATFDLLCLFARLDEEPGATLFTCGTDVGCGTDVDKCEGNPGCGVVDLCCFSMCSSVCAAGWDIKRANIGLLSATPTLCAFGWSPALKWPVLTWKPKKSFNFIL